ncbi:unnamed protein product [Ambrosiozyma monospora]|uniref:Unnamed protein product n=1 Tax=Ambrosiozyma monospora TaxID=43982 RepID=A0ACB5T8I5_AMBMO|nr:unnamed protein product [Ambrosiozyma monospora]
MNKNEVFSEGPTTSQHVESMDEDHFQKSTYKLKRTRSMGLLDDFIVQTRALDTNSIDSSNKKLTNRDFVSDETLQKLAIKPTYSEEELGHVPSFYTSVISPSVRKKMGVPVDNNINSNSPSSMQKTTTYS